MRTSKNAEMDQPEMSATPEEAKVMLSCRIRASLRRRLKVVASELDVQMALIVEVALSKELQNLEEVTK